MLSISPHTRIVALDLETTGLSAIRHRIVELAAVCWQDGEETGAFQTLVNPDCPMPLRVIKVHGITDEMLQDQPRIHEVLPAFLDFCDAEVVLAHNSPFDTRFLDAECTLLGLPLFTRPVLDTCMLARERLPGCPNYRLETLKAALGLGRGVAHRGLADARDCLGVYLRCMEAVPPTLRLPVLPPSLPEHLTPLSEALANGGNVIIEYRDVRGNHTLREVQPLFIDTHIMQAFCLLRQDKRHFSLERIERILHVVKQS